MGQKELLTEPFNHTEILLCNLAGLSGTSHLNVSRKMPLCL